VGQLPAPDGNVVITTTIAACSGYLVESAANAYTACVPGEAQPSFSYYGVAADHSVVFHAPENATDLGAPIWLDRPGKPSLELDSSPNDFDPSISPDGSKVTFARFSPSGTSSDIYTVHSDGSGLTLVASGHGMNLLGHPKFSPDGGSIAYACGPPGPHSASACGPLPGGGTSPSGLMLMNSDGTNPRMIVVFLGGPNGGYQLDVGAGQDFSWSPDGQRIATENEVNGSWQVFAYRTDGSDLFNELSPARQITHQLGLQGGYTDPQFSPTGTEIMYVRSSDGSGTLGNFSYVVKPDGTNTHEVFLTFDPADFQPGVFVPPALGGAPSATVRATQATVPPVGTLSLQAATRRLTGVKLTGTVAGRSYSSKVQRGAVLSQYPSARTRASLKTSKSRTVKLVISLGRLPATTKRR
jgi:hypothetical protein